MFGVAIGIITMRFAASLFTLMITKEPILKPAAYIVVFNIGAELLLHEFWGVEFNSTLKFMISAGTLVVAVIYGRIKTLHVIQPFFTWIGQGMSNINELLDWALKPLTFSVRMSFRGMAFIVITLLSFIRNQ